LSNKPDSDKLHSNKFGEREKQAPIIYQTARKRMYLRNAKTAKKCKIIFQKQKNSFQDAELLKLVRIFNSVPEVGFSLQVLHLGPMLLFFIYWGGHPPPY
jgi:hypothetical protein